MTYSHAPSTRTVLSLAGVEMLLNDSVTSRFACYSSANTALRSDCSSSVPYTQIPSAKIVRRSSPTRRALSTDSTYCSKSNRSPFDREATAAAILSSENYRAWLLDTEDAIERFSERRQLWRQKAEEVTNEAEALSERQRNIETRIDELHSEWDGAFEHRSTESQPNLS